MSEHVQQRGGWGCILTVNARSRMCKSGAAIPSSSPMVLESCREGQPIASEHPTAHTQGYPWMLWVSQCLGCMCHVPHTHIIRKWALIFPYLRLLRLLISTQQGLGE